MRDSSKYASCLSRLCNRLRRQKGAAAIGRDTEPKDILTELIRGCLSAGTTESKAQAALNKLKNYFVDFNELRVCRVEELTEVLGGSFPEAKSVAGQIRSVLSQVFAQRSSLDMSWLRTCGKREAKSFLMSLEGATPYVVGRVMLYSLEGHAFPTNASILAMLRDEEAVDPDADAAEVEGFLERQIPSSRIIRIYSLLRWYADNYRGKTKGSTRKKTTRTKKQTKTKRKTKTKTKTKKTR